MDDDNDYWDYEDDPIMEQREEIMVSALKWRMGITGMFSYANLHYLVAAAMAEKIEGKPFEEIMKEKLFEPLEMETCGFGPHNDAWGHIIRNNVWFPTQYDSSPVLHPANGVHCSVPDYGKFLVMQFEGVNPKILSREIIREL